MLATDKVYVVIPLVIIRSDMSGTIARVADWSCPSEIHDRQAVRLRIAGLDYSRNAELIREAEPCIPVLGINEEPGPTEARRVDGSWGEDVRFTDNRLLRGVARGSRNGGSDQRHRENAGLQDIVAGPAIPNVAAVFVAETMVHLDVEGVFSDRTRWIEKEVVGDRRPWNIRSGIFLVEVQNVRARLVYIGERNEIVGVRNAGSRVLDERGICREIIAGGGQIEVWDGINESQPLACALAGIVSEEKCFGIVPRK